MLPISLRSSGWEKFRHESNKENIPTNFNDSFFSLSTSGSSNIWRPMLDSEPFKDYNKTYAIPTYLNCSSNDSGSISPGSSGYESLSKPESENFEIHHDVLASSFNELALSFDSLLPLNPKNPINLFMNEESIATSLSSFSYSPLSSFKSEGKRLPAFPDLEFIG